MRLLFALLFATAVAAAQDVQVDATVNAERIGVEDVLELTVSISGGDPEGEPQLPDLPGFRAAGRSTSSQIQIVNGRMSSTRAYIYQLLPQNEGKFTLGAVTVQAGGKTYRTRPIEVEVVSGSVVSRRPRGFGSPLDPFDRLDPFARRREPQLEPDDAFVRAEISKQSVVQGEQVVVTYRLFSRYTPLGPEIADDPPLTGFWVEQVDQERFSESRTIDGKSYRVYPILQRVLFPTMTGKLAIPPVTFSTAFRLSSSDPFDAFFARASSPVTLRSQPLEIDVAPLPAAGRARDFKGAVGRYRLDAVLNKSEVNAGEPLTLTLSLSGKGNLRSIEAPEFPPPGGFRTFAPKVQETSRATGSGLEGEKKWEYVLVPESGGVKEIGPWTFPYFDPEEKKYVAASAGPLEIRIAGGTALPTAGAGTGSRGEVTLLRQDIRFLKPAPERLGSTEGPFHQSPLFYASLIVPVLWNVGLVVYLRRRQKEKTHSQLFRRRRAHRMARHRLKHAAKLAAQASKDFYEEIAGALYRYVGDKASQSPSGLTLSSIEAILESRSVPEELRRSFRDVLGECEEARFTPGPRSGKDMEALRARTEELIVAIERHWSK